MKVEDLRDEVFLTTRQASQVLNVGISSIKRYIYEGKIKAYKTPGGHHRIPKSELFRALEPEPALK